MLLEYDKFTIHNIKDIHKSIVDDFNFSSHIAIDFQNIDEIDLSGLQLLVSLKQSCESKGKTFQLKNIKDEIIYAFEISGISEVLEV